MNVNSNTGSNDPVVNIPLNLDRLRCCVAILYDLFRYSTFFVNRQELDILLRTPTPRPVQLPLGLLVRFIIGILTSSSEKQVSALYREIALERELW